MKRRYRIILLILLIVVVVTIGVFIVQEQKDKNVTFDGHIGMYSTKQKFNQFIEGNKGQETPIQIESYHTYFSGGHKELFNAIYEDTKQSEYRVAFQYMNKHAEEIEMIYAQIEKELAREIRKQQSLFSKFDTSDMKVIIAPSLLTTNAEVLSPIDGKRYILFAPDKIYYNMSEKDYSYIFSVLFDHEVTHAIQFTESNVNSLGSRMYPLWRSIWIEGIACYGAKTLSGITTDDYILGKELASVYKQNLSVWAKEFLEDTEGVPIVSKGTWEQSEKKWFGETGEEELGINYAGYALGYEAVQSLSKTYTYEQLVRMDYKEGFQLIKKEIEKIAENE